MAETTVLRTRSRIEWMGRHSGYDRGCDFLDGCSEEWRFVDVYRRADRLGPLRVRYFEHRRRRYSESPSYDMYSYLLEREVQRTAATERPDLVHLMYLEKDLGLLQDRTKIGASALIATAHQPRSWWRMAHGRPEVVQSLDGLIALTDREADFWEQFLPGRVSVARHGIDVDFFCPSHSTTISESEPRCLVVGHWQRDFATLAGVVDVLLKRIPEIGFDIVIPRVVRSVDLLMPLARHDSVRFREGLTDEELLELYRRSTVLLLPMLAATANNAILEAQACGLPIVSTDVDGVASYVTPAFADLVPVGDVQALVDAVIRLIESDEEREERGRAGREHAVEQLSWRRLAPLVLDAYERVLQRGTG